MDWGAIIIAALTGGAIVKLLDVLGNRKIVEAQAKEATARSAEILLKNSEIRIGNLTDKVKDQDVLITGLRNELYDLKREITTRDTEIRELKKLKAEQAEQIQKLQQDVAERDSKIAEQTATIESLALRITKLESELERLQGGNKC